jgi:hypothetical protein
LSTNHSIVLPARKSQVYEENNHVELENMVNITFSNFIASFLELFHAALLNMVVPTTL